MLRRNLPLCTPYFLAIWPPNYCKALRAGNGRFRKNQSPPPLVQAVFLDFDFGRKKKSKVYYMVGPPSPLPFRFFYLHSDNEMEKVRNAPSPNPGQARYKAIQYINYIVTVSTGNIIGWCY